VSEPNGTVTTHEITMLVDGQPVTYRTPTEHEAAQERQIAALIAAIKEHPSSGSVTGGAPRESTPLVATALRQLSERLDHIERALGTPRGGLAPETVNLFGTRLDRIEERLNQPIQVAWPATYEQRLGRIEAACREGIVATLTDEMRGSDDGLLARHVEVLGAVRQLAARVETLAGDVRLLVDIADQATAPAPEPAEAPAPTGADFLGASRAQSQEWLARYLTTPSLTMREIGAALGISDEGARLRLQNAAKATGQLAAFRARGRLGISRAATSRSKSAAAGGPRPASITAGSSS
jgi:hypothetical protein